MKAIIAPMMRRIKTAGNAVATASTRKSECATKR
jgi:hypothetical protein